MKIRLNNVLGKKYHEDQLINILISNRFRVDRIKKIVSNPSFETSAHLQQIRLELSAILWQLNQLGWYVPSAK
ncbi:hypothetical protein [Carboxylicivirga sp. RSCT41]|uniref:hypothetical protein n=1 Tax=Carboxylicivirga agarovorans TaxID=3417570 RepID=UPI003D342439